MLIGIDSRRGIGSGIGRAGQLLLRSLIAADIYDLLIVTSNAAETQVSLGNDSRFSRKVDFLEVQDRTFSQGDLTQLPRLINRRKVDLFIAPHTFLSPFLTVPKINSLHDLWFLYYPEWIPDLQSFCARFGSDSMEFVGCVLERFRTLFRPSPIGRSNLHISEALRLTASDPVRAFYTALTVLNLESARIVAVPSNFTKNTVTDCFPEFAEKIRVVPLFSLVGSIPNQKENEPGFVLNVCKWTARKNLLPLVEAVRAVRGKGFEMKLVLAGEQGNSEYARAVKRLISQRPYRDFIAAFNKVSEAELWELYRTAYLSVSPSLYEGFGLPVLESLANGTPVVASDIGAHREVAADAAVFVKPTAENIASSILAIIRHEKPYDVLQKAGQRRSAEYTIQRSIDDWGSAIDDAL